MGISTYYDDLYSSKSTYTNNNLVSNTASTVSSTDNSNTDSDSTSKSSLTDKIYLNSSISDLPYYLDYNSSGKYSLADFLNDDSDTEDNSLIDSLKTDDSSDSSNLSSIADSIGSDDSISDTFKKIADAKSKEVDDWISKALKGMGGTGNNI